MYLSFKETSFAMIFTLKNVFFLILKLLIVIIINKLLIISNGYKFNKKCKHLYFGETQSYDSTKFWQFKIIMNKI